MLEFDIIDPKKQNTISGIKYGMFAYAFKASTMNGKVWLKSSMLPRYLAGRYEVPESDSTSIHTYFPEYFACIGYPEKFILTQDKDGRIAAISCKGMNGIDINWNGEDVFASYKHDGLRWNPTGSLVDSTLELEREEKDNLVRLALPVSPLELELTLDRIGAYRHRDNRLLTSKSRSAKVHTALFMDAMLFRKLMLMKDSLCGEIENIPQSLGCHDEPIILGLPAKVYR